MSLLAGSKRLGGLHIAAALRQDFEQLLSKFILGTDLSFGHFKVLWKTENFATIHHGKTEKIGYKAFVQLAYEAILLLVQNDLTEEHELVTSTPRLQLIVESATRKNVWNIGVMYCLYTFYKTQLASHQEPGPTPIHIGPESAVSLSLAVRRLSTLAECGRTAVSMYQTMLKADAFRYCAYTGPTSLYYCQKAGKKAIGQTADTIATLIQSENHTTTTTVVSVGSSSSSSNASHSTAECVPDDGAVHLIRQLYSMGARTSRHSAPIPQTATATLEVTAMTTTASIEAAKETQIVELAAAMSGEVPVIIPPEPPLLDVTEYLTQSIAERRQMRADKAKQRQLQQEELEATRVQKLRVRVLKRLEKHDAVNQVAPVPVAQDNPINRRGPRRTHAMRLQEEAALQDAAQEEDSRGPGRNTRRSSAPPLASQRVDSAISGAAPPSRRTRASSKELPDQASVSRLVPTGRRVAETPASRDAYLQENDDLMEDFEEFVGLRPKSTRSTTASVSNSAGHSSSVVARGVRSTRSTPVEEEPEVHLDAATGDIMDILRQLEQDSQRVLDRGGSGRALRSSATTSTTPSAASNARTSRQSSGVPEAAAKPVPAPRQPRAAAVHPSEPSASAGFGALELREVGKKRKAPASAPTKRARASARQAEVEEEDPVAEDDSMGMLQRLERESDRILGGGASQATESADESENISLPDKSAPAARRKNKEREEFHHADPKPRAAPKRRAVSATTASTSTKRSPAKTARTQRTAASRRTEPVDAPLSAESGDIMALLQRLEQESDLILGGDVPESAAATTSVVSSAAASEPAVRKATKTRTRALQLRSDLPEQPPRASKRISREISADEASTSPPAAKAPRKAPTRAADKVKMPAKTFTRQKNGAATLACDQDNVNMSNTELRESADFVSPPAAHTKAAEGSEGMDIMDMLKQLEEEANGILSAQK